MTTKKGGVHMYKNDNIFEFYLKNNNKKDKKESEDLSEASRKILS